MSADNPAAGPLLFSDTLHRLQQVWSGATKLSFVLFRGSRGRESTSPSCPSSATALLGPCSPVQLELETAQGSRAAQRMETRLQEPSFTPFGTLWAVSQAMHHVASQKVVEGEDGTKAEEVSIVNELVVVVVGGSGTGLTRKRPGVVPN